MWKKFEQLFMAAFCAIVFGLFFSLANIHDWARANVLTIPNNFSAGQKIVASSVNANFSAIATVVNGGIASDNIVDGGVASQDLATSSVVTSKIADGAVTGDKILNGTITANKLASGVYYWKGYHSSSCTWTTTQGGGFGAFNADGSCTLTEEQNSGFGTVVTYFNAPTGSTTALPGITFTPPQIGKYLVCVNFYGQNQSVNGGDIYRLFSVNASTSLVEFFNRNEGTSAARDTNVSGCGIYSADTASATRTLVMQGGTNGVGTCAINNFQQTYIRSSIEWMIHSL